MKTKLFLFLIGLALTLSSCDKSIKGKVIDNFNKPINDVKICIKNSAFESFSDKEGGFKIDYVAGKFEIMFEKDKYIPISKELEINERANYPIGTIKMTRIPDSTGIYFKGKDDFLKIPIITLRKENVTRTSFGTKFIVGHSFYLPDNDVFKIGVDSINTIEIFDSSNLKLFLLETTNNYVAKNVTPDSYAGFSRFIFGNQVNTESEKIGLGVKTYIFKPEFNKKYVFISYKGDEFSQEMLTKAFAFEFLKK